MDPEDDDNDGCERDRGLNCFVDVMDLVGYKGPQGGEENGVQTWRTKEEKARMEGMTVE